MESDNQSGGTAGDAGGAPTDAEYARLLDLRVRLRRFDRWSRDTVGELGLTHAQHQLLLAVRGHDGETGPTLREVADYLLVGQPAATELADRTAALGLVERVADTADARRVRLRLTGEGRRVIGDLTALHLTELRSLAAVLSGL